eukprot:Em0011g19a
MPRGKKRLRLRVYDDCFAGCDALQWLLEHLQTTELFGTVNRTQVEKLLQKFVQNEVIVDIKRKDNGFSESTYYQFVTEPRALNFIDDTPKPKGATDDRPAAGMEENEGLCIANEYAFAQCSYSSLAKSGDLVMADQMYEEPRSLAGAWKVAPEQVAGVWKEMTLARLLQVVELSSLDGVVSYKEVNGHHIAHNVSKVPSSGSLSNGEIPQWVLLAIKCVAEWPEGCTEEFVGGLPVYQGLELDVLQSLVVYFSLQTEPLISFSLGDLFAAVLRLIREKKSSGLAAMQLCLLLLPQASRARLHTVTRLIHDAAHNKELILSRSKTNFDELLDLFSPVVLRPSKGRLDEGGVRDLMTFLVQQHHNVFKTPENLKHDVESRLSAMSSGQGDGTVATQSSYCHRVSREEYDKQKNMSEEFLVGLLAKIVNDSEMPAKMKKKRLHQFEKAYPQLYRQYHSTPNLSSPDHTNIAAPLR